MRRSTGVITLGIFLLTLAALLIAFWRLHRIELLIALASFLLVFILWKVPELQLTALRSDPDMKPDRRLELEDRYRTTLAQVLGGTFFFVTAYFSWEEIQNTKEAQAKQFQISQEQIRISQEGQITDRFNKAIDQLSTSGADGLPRRLGAIYALERIARDSEKDHWSVMQVLAAYIRDRAAWKANLSSQGLPPQDIQAILKVFGQRDLTHKEYGYLDLQNTNLQNMVLSYAQMGRCYFYKAHLNGMVLNRASFRESVFTEADLSSADLSEADLWHVDLTKADLTSTNLRAAHLEGADLTSAKVTQSQLDSAVTDSQTKVSPSLILHPKTN